MKIKITNFCNISYAEYDFGDFGITLLDGRSGIGKTTIMDAIYYVLYGSGFKYSTHTKTDSKSNETKNQTIIELSTPEFIAMRSNKPNSFTVSISDSKTFYEDAAAQEYINKKMGSVFNVSSYIAQNSFQSFITMDPADKLLFIEKLAFSENNISELKKKIKDLTKTYNENLISVSSKYETTKAFLEKTSTSFTKLENPGKKPKYSHSRLLEYENCRSKFNKQLQETKRFLEKKQIYKKVNSEIRDKIKKCKAEIVSIDFEKLKKIEFELEKINTYKTCSALLEMKLQEEKEIESLKITLTSSNENVDSEISSGNQFRQAEFELSECKIIKDDILKVKSLTSKLKTSPGGIPSSKQLEEQYNELTQRFKQQSSVYTCPMCSSSLCIRECKLEVLTTQNYFGKVSEDDIKKARIKLQEAREHENILNEIQLVKSNYTDNILPDLAEIESDIQKFTKLKDTQLKLQSHQIRLSEINKKIKNYEVCDVSKEFEIKNEIDSLKKQKYKNEQIQKQITQYIQDLNKNNITQELGSRLKSLKHLRKKIHSLDTKIEVMKQKEKELLVYNSKLKEYTRYLQEKKDLTTLKQKVKQLFLELEECKKFYSAVQKMKDKLLEAESIVITNLIENINIHAQVHLDKFFPDFPISVKCCSFKETKKSSASATLKPQVNTVIEYKDREFSNVMSLSGGELNRVVLAFTLALGEICNTPLFLFDECGANLDSDTMSLIVNHIKYTFPNKLIIIIAHQAITGIYDKVICVK